MRSAFDNQYIHNYYLQIYNNPDIYFYGVSISLSLIFLFSGGWDSKTRTSLLEIIEHQTKRIALGLSFIFILLVPPALFFMANKYYGESHVSYWNYIFKEGLHKSIYTLIAFPFVTIWTKFIFKRYVFPWFSNLKNATRIRLSNSNESDIRVEEGELKQSNIDPKTKYKNKHILIGMSPEDSPIYLDYEDWKFKHMRIVAPSTTGKGVLIGSMLDQVIRLGSLPIMIDGKPDRHAKAIMQKACQDVGRSFIEINFYDKSDYCFEPYLCGTISEIKQRLWMDLDLKDSGTMADHYKKNERHFISEFIKSGWDRKIQSLLTCLINQKEFNAVGSIEVLEEFMLMPAINCQKNILDIDSLLQSNTVIYIRSSLKDTQIKKATNCLLMNIIQSINRQDFKGEVHRPIFVDEVKFFVSELLAESLATIADFGANFVLTYQSYSDILSISDQRVNAKAVAKSIDTNCLITYAGQASDGESAEYFEKETGTVIKKVYDRLKISTNETGGDQFEGEAFLTNKESALITLNQFLTFPKRVGVLINKPYTAKIVRTSFIPIDTEKEYDYHKPIYSNAKTELKNIEEKEMMNDLIEAKNINDNKPNKILSIDDIEDGINFSRNTGEDDDYSELYD